MKINILFLKSDKGFNKKEKRKIENIIKETASRAAKVLNLKSSIINFTVYRFNKRYIGAFTQAEDFIQLSVPRTRNLNEEVLRNTLYHEMHHIKRGYVGYPNKKITLLEMLISEGLAIVFALEMVPKSIPKWSKYTENFIKKWLPKVKKEKFNMDYYHEKWFFSTIGYKIGTYFVHQVQKNYPKLKSEDLAKKNARSLLKLSKVKI